MHWNYCLRCKAYRRAGKPGCDVCEEPTFLAEGQRSELKRSLIRDNTQKANHAASLLRKDFRRWCYWSGVERSRACKLAREQYPSVKGRLLKEIPPRGDIKPLPDSQGLWWCVRTGQPIVVYSSGGTLLWEQYGRYPTLSLGLLKQNAWRKGETVD